MKPVHWIAGTKKEILDFPDTVRSEVGYTLYLAQMGDKSINAVPMLGFGSAKVLEVIINDTGESFRAVYSVKFARAIYVLHAFHKKSKNGIATPHHDLDVIKARLKIAELHY